MEQDYCIRTIARIHSAFSEKFGIPRQSGLVEGLKSFIVFEPPFRSQDALKGLEAFSHLWLIWGFSENKRNTWSPTVRPPRLGGNTRMGVFATRSPFRPNPLGLSCVKLDKIEQNAQLGPILHVSGADLMDNTPIFDIKPYLPYVDSRPEASDGFASLYRDYALSVNFPDSLLIKVPTDMQEALLGVLSQDPRPSYQDDPERIYGLSFAGLNIKFKVCDQKLIVCSVENNIFSEKRPK